MYRVITMIITLYGKRYLLSINYDFTLYGKDMYRVLTMISHCMEKDIL